MRLNVKQVWRFRLKSSLFSDIWLLSALRFLHEYGGKRHPDYPEQKEINRLFVARLFGIPSSSFYTLVATLDNDWQSLPVEYLDNLTLPEIASNFKAKRVFSVAEENYIAEFLKQMCWVGKGFTKDQFLKFVQGMAVKFQLASDFKASRGFFDGFMGRFPELKQLKSSALDFKRKDKATEDMRAATWDGVDSMVKFLYETNQIPYPRAGQPNQNFAMMKVSAGLAFDLMHL